jgi:hypothetical protein
MTVFLESLIVIVRFNGNLLAFTKWKKRKELFLVTDDEGRFHSRR